MCDRLLEGSQNYVNNEAAKNNIDGVRVNVRPRNAFECSTRPFTIGEKRDIVRYFRDIAGYTRPAEATIYTKRANGDVVCSVITNMRSLAD